MPLQRRRRTPREQDHIRSKQLRSQARSFIRRVLSGCLPDDGYGDIEKSRPMLKIGAPTDFVHHKITIPGLESYTSGVSFSEHTWPTASRTSDAKMTCLDTKTSCLDDSDSSTDSGSRPGTSSRHLDGSVISEHHLDALQEDPMAFSPLHHEPAIEHYSPLTSSPPNHHEHLLQRHIFTPAASPAPALPPRPATAAAGAMITDAGAHKRRKSLGDTLAMLSRRSKSVAGFGTMTESVELAESRRSGSGMLRKSKTTGERTEEQL